MTAAVARAGESSPELGSAFGHGGWAGEEGPAQRQGLGQCRSH